MTVRDDLVLIGWLAGLAPEAAHLPGAGEAATKALLASYPQGGLDEGLANCLRRCVATSLVPLFPVEEVGDRQRAVMARKDLFRGTLDREEPAIVAIARAVDEVLPRRGHQVASAVLEIFRTQARELFPREESGGAKLAIAVVEALHGAADAHARLRIEPELASLHQRGGDPERAAELRGAEDGFTWLDQADAAAGHGDMDAARAALHRASQVFARAGQLPGIAAVKRREAALLDPPDRVSLLVEAVRLSREAHGDHRGEVEGLEELSRAYAEDGRTGPAVAVLGEMARIQREAVDPAGEARALQLAGRLLCEAFGEQQEPGPGLVMLLFAADIGGSVDAVLADLTHRYVQGFQYTLSDAEWARIEPLFDQDRAAVVDGTFARYRERYRTELP